MAAKDYHHGETPPSKVTTDTPYSRKSPGTTTRRRRVVQKEKKKCSDDQFMAASIGDLAWLKQSMANYEPGTDLRTDKNGLTSLHLASLHAHLDCLKYLVTDLKCNVNISSELGWRPIHLVINTDSGKRAYQCLEFLLENGADPSVQNNDGTTPSHQAASEGHLQCLHLLIDYKADIRHPDSRGHTPLELAKIWAHRKCARLLSSTLWITSTDEVAKEMHRLKQLRKAQARHDVESGIEEKAKKHIKHHFNYRNWLKRHLGEEDMITAEEIELAIERRLSDTIRKVSKYQGNNLLPIDDLKSKASVVSQPGQIVYGVPRIVEPDLSNVDIEKSGHTLEKKVTFTNDVAVGNVKTQNQWNFSPKFPPKSYTMNLNDDYPRDMYTKMPKIKNALKYYDGSFRNVTWIDLDENNVVFNKANAEKFKRYKEKTLKEITLPTEKVKQLLSKDPSLRTRPFVFETQHIEDITALKKFGNNEKIVGEAGLHIYPDEHTYSFQNILQRDQMSGSAVKSEISITDMLQNYSIFERPKFVCDRVRNAILKPKNLTKTLDETPIMNQLTKMRQKIKDNTSQIRS